MKEKIKGIVLVVLAIVAVITLIYGFTASSKKRPVTQRAQGAQSSQGVEKARAAVAGPVERRAARTKIVSWRRSPFAPKGAHGATSSRLVLNGVVSEGKDLRAVIGDAVVKKGDKVGTYTVVTITKNSATITDGTETLSLKLER